MRRSILAIAVFLAALFYVSQRPAEAAYVPAPTSCTQHAFVHITTATDTTLVALSAGKTIYICDFDFSSTGVQTFYLEGSTSSTCASTFTQISILWTLVANESKTDGKPFFSGLAPANGSSLCVHTTAAVAIDIGVSYVQQ
jgi:hypothetical protein